MLAGLQSKYVDRTVVSSNCDEVRKVYNKFTEPLINKMSKLPMRERYGNPDVGPVPFFVGRPDEISGDLSKNEEALIHVLDFFKGRGESDYDIIINLQPTSPCRLSGLLDRCLEAYDEGGYNSLLTATKTTPFLWQKRDGKWGYIVDKNDCCNRKMRQEFKDFEMVLHDNGNMYIVDTNVLIDTNCRIGDNPCVFETEGINSLQIDEEFDFELIEQMAKVKGLTTLI